jgi:hypothetical protein
MEWLRSILDLAEMITGLSNQVRGNRAIKAQLIRELKLNLKAYEVQRRRGLTDFDMLLNQMSNKVMKHQIQSGYKFRRINNGVITEQHLRDRRNSRYLGKDCQWLFSNIDIKIEELRLLQQCTPGGLRNASGANLSLQFSNLFYKIRLLADFVH